MNKKTIRILNYVLFLLIQIPFSEAASANSLCERMRHGFYKFFGAKYDDAQGIWAPDISGGDRISSVLEFNLPKDFVNRFPTEVAKLLSILRTIHKERFEYIKEDFFGSYDVLTNSLELNVRVARGRHPISIFIDARHEVRHFLSNQASEYRDKLKFIGRTNMTREEFAQENLRVFAYEESISQYDEILFTNRVSEVPEYAAIAESTTTAMQKALREFLNQENPAPGVKTIESIRDWMIENTKYRELWRKQLQEIFDYVEFYKDSDRTTGEILNGQNVREAYKVGAN